MNKKRQPSLRELKKKAKAYDVLVAAIEAADRMRFALGSFPTNVLEYDWKQLVASVREG